MDGITLYQNLHDKIDMERRKYWQILKVRTKTEFLELVRDWADDQDLKVTLYETLCFRASLFAAQELLEQSTPETIDRFQINPESSRMTLFSLKTNHDLGRATMSPELLEIYDLLIIKY